MPILENLWIIPLLPLLGSAVNGLFGAKWTHQVVNSVALGSTGLSFACALEAVREFVAAGQQPFRKEFVDWMTAGNFRTGFDLQFDQLTVVMVLVVTGVGFLIHIYSTGYMAHEGGYYRFFSYLNLFMFFMLILVLAANYVLLFVGWEGVGLSSYLLIGFWFLKKSATDAGKKAFIVNRIGDFGFMLGMFCCSELLGRWISRRSLARPVLGPRNRWATSARLRLPAFCSSWAQPESPPSFRSTSGCPMRWKVRHPSAR